jgi:competence protein ComEC
MESTKANIFLLFMLGFLTGVFEASVWHFSFLLGICFLMLGTLIMFTDLHNSRKKWLFFIILGIFLGGWRVDHNLKKIYPRAEKEFSGLVLVSKEPERKDDYQQIEVCPLVGSYYNCQEKYLINTVLYPGYQYGDQLEVSCLLKNPENRNEKFNYVRFLAKDDIYQVCQKTKIRSKLEGDQKIQLPIGSIIKERIYLFKKSLEDKINLLFPHPESGYLAGLLLGGDDRLPKEAAENFRRTGTTHTVAVSGYNITILAQFLMISGIAIGLWRQQAFYLAISGIVIFVLAIGAPASAVRAAIMGGLILLANKKGRLSNSYRLIILAGSIMVFFSPLSLLYDMGFQLSFLATLSIVSIYAPLAEKFEIKNDFLGLKSIFYVTISAQLGVLGILIYNFESFSLISFLANLIILPLVPYIMFFGFLTVLLSFLSFSVAKILALPVWLALHLEMKIIEHLAKYSWSIIKIENITWHWLFGYYVFLILFIIWLGKKEKSV